MLAPKPSQPKPGPTAPAPQPSQPEPSPTAPQKPVVPVSPQTAIIAALDALKGTSLESVVQVDRILASAGVDYTGGPAGYPTLGQEVDASAALPGDLVYYPDGGSGEPHVAIYTGNGNAVHNGQSISGSTVENGMPFIYIRISG